jgi:hypothetical protein
MLTIVSPPAVQNFWSRQGQNRSPFVDNQNRESSAAPLIYVSR